MLILFITFLEQLIVNIIHYFFCPLIDNIFHYSVALMSKGLAPVRGLVIAHQQFNFFSRKFSSSQYRARIIAGTMKVV